MRNVSIKGRLWGFYFNPFFGANYTFMSAPRPPSTFGNYSYRRGDSKGPQSNVGDMIAFNAYNGETMLFQVQEIFSAESALLSADLVLMSGDDLGPLRHPKGQSHKSHPEGQEPSRTRHNCTKNCSDPAQHEADNQGRDIEDIRFHLQLAGRSNHRNPFCCRYLIFHLRMG